MSSQYWLRQRDCLVVDLIRRRWCSRHALSLRSPHFLLLLYLWMNMHAIWGSTLGPNCSLCSEWLRPPSPWWYEAMKYTAAILSFSHTLDLYQNGWTYRQTFSPMVALQFEFYYFLCIKRFLIWRTTRDALYVSYLICELKSSRSQSWIQGLLFYFHIKCRMPLSTWKWQNSSSAASYSVSWCWVTCDT